MAKIIIKRNKSFCGSAHNFDVYLANTYVGELKTGGQLEINVDVGSHMLFFKSRLKLGKSLSTSFEAVVNEPDEVVEIKSGFNIGNGNFTVEYADNAPHIPMYADLNDIESATYSANEIPTGQSKLYCSKCGTEMIGDAKFCNKCGQALKQPYIQVATSAKTSNLKYKNLIRCRSCGALVAKNAKSCPKCGAKTPSQLVGETVTGIGCGLLSVPIIIFLIIIFLIVTSTLLGSESSTSGGTNTPTVNETESVEQQNNILYSDGFFDIEYMKVSNAPGVTAAYLQLKVTNKNTQKVTLMLDDVYVNDIFIETGTGMPIELENGKISTTPFILFTGNTGLKAEDIKKIEFKLKGYDDEFNVIHTTNKIIVEK